MGCNHHWKDAIDFDGTCCRHCGIRLQDEHDLLYLNATLDKIHKLAVSKWNKETDGWLKVMQLADPGLRKLQSGKLELEDDE